MSEGRGTTKPFEYIGAPWCNSERWAETLNALSLPGVLFRPVVFTPARVVAQNTRSRPAAALQSILPIENASFP